MAHTACLVCLISTVSGRSQKRLKCGAGSGHTTKLEQARFSLDIYGCKGLILVYNITELKVLKHWVLGMPHIVYLLSTAICLKGGHLL